MNNNFNLIAIRCNSKDSIGRKGLQDGVIYYFLKGYEITESDITEYCWRKNQDSIFDRYYTNSKGIPHIQISAIVGKNGTGKSSIIEFLMRLINNLGASIIGEYKNEPMAEHLHYIRGVYGDLWYLLGDSIYQLTINADIVQLYEFKKSSTDQTGESVFHKSTSPVLEIKPRIEGYFYRNDLQELEHFFYSIISNYSIYAYNTLDYETECNTSDDENHILNPDNEKKAFSVEDRCWLHGVFHKNDGYLTPMVITPFRKEGNIDVNKENHLAKERLLSLFIKHKDYRTIKDELDVIGISLDFNKKRIYQYNEVKEMLDINEMSKILYNSLREEIINKCTEIFNFSVKGTNEEKIALDYLVYKILKISKISKYHRDLYLDLYRNKSINEVILDKCITNISKDYSHTTRKLYQCIAFLKYDIYNSDNTKYDFDHIYVKWNNISSQNDKKLDKHIREVAILPPPFCNFEFTFSNGVRFEGLSSGEKQKIYAISSIIYHLDNLNSVFGDLSNPIRTKYSYVNIVLEEIELYYHPDYQREFLFSIIKAIHKTTLTNIKAINILVVTHSPYVLSDIPHTNVLTLGNQPKELKELKTFGANIHEMLKNSFFMENGTAGEFSDWMIGHIIASLDIHQRIKDNDNQTLYLSDLKQKECYHFIDKYIVNNKFSYENFKKDYSEKSIRFLIGLIDNPIVQRILIEKFLKTFPLSEEIEKKRKDLLRQLKELEFNE